MGFKSSSALILLSVIMLCAGLPGYDSASGQAIEDDVPVEYRDRYDKMNQWLSRKLVEWKPLKYNEMSFCAHHVFASEQMINSTDKSFDIPFLEILKETGIDCVRLSIFPYNYEKYRQRYENLIAAIRDSSLKLMVAYMVGDLPPGTVTSFEEYKARELDFTEMFIERYKPEYYAVVTEPITMEKRIKLGQRLPDDQWVGLVEETVNLVKNINPGTKTIAAVNTESGQLDMAKQFAGIPNLDIVAFQLYGPAGMYKEYKGWVGNADVVTQAIDYAEAHKKDTWITETWLSIPTVETWKGSQSANTCFNEPYMAPLDADWLKVITYYAQRHNVKGICPFFTGKFVSYPSSSQNGQKDNFLRDFKDNKRTAPFYAYKEIIEETRRNNE